MSLVFLHLHTASNTSLPSPNMPSEGDSKQDKQASAAQARQVIDVFHEISTLLVSFESTRTLSSKAKSNRVLLECRPRPPDVVYLHITD